MNKCVFTPFLGSIFLAGCSSLPLPQDATGVTTQEIINHFRCEARKSVKEAALEVLYRLDYKKATRYKTGYQLAEELRPLESWKNTVDVGDFVGDAKESFEYYKSTQIAYEFTLKITENNLQGAGMTLLRPFFRRKDTVDFSLSGDRTRDNSRVFAVMDTFRDLALDIVNIDCSNEHDKNDNFIYPATGRMPLNDLIHSYIVANEFGNLQGTSPGNLTGTEKRPAIPKMADTLTFTTRVTGKSNPSIDLNPVGSGFLFSKLSLTNENYREDMHKVVISVTTAEVDKVAQPGKPNAPKVAVQPSDEKRLETAYKAIDDQRNKNFQDAVISISNSLAKISSF